MRASRIIGHRTIAAAALALGLGLGVSACAPPGGGAGGALGGLDPEEPPVILPTPTPTPSAMDPEADGGFTVCDDASPAALAAVNASIAADPGPYPGLQLDGLETMWDADQQVWTLAGMIGPVVPEPGPETGHRVALWATDQDPSRDDFAGTVWSAVNGSDMVSAAPQLESFPQLTMDGPDPAGLWCSDLYPEAAGD